MTYKRDMEGNIDAFCSQCHSNKTFTLIFSTTDDGTPDISYELRKCEVCGKPLWFKVVRTPSTGPGMDRIDDISIW